MLFVDGENLTLEGQKISPPDGQPLGLKEGKFFKRDVFLWFPERDPLRDEWLPGAVRDGLWPFGECAFYYTAITGSENDRREVRESLRALGFEPQVFLKPKGKKAKGVDISIARDLLCHAFRDNYDVAVLMAGDADYVPLVREVKRMGKSVCLCFYENSCLSDELTLEADFSCDQADSLWRTWRLRGAK